MATEFDENQSHCIRLGLRLISHEFVVGLDEVRFLELKFTRQKFGGYKFGSGPKTHCVHKSGSRGGCASLRFSGPKSSNKSFGRFGNLPEDLQIFHSDLEIFHSDLEIFHRDFIITESVICYHWSNHSRDFM